MKLHFSDGERTAELGLRLVRFDVLWLKGQIGDATYLRSLFIDGVDTADAVSRLNSLKMERT